MAMLERGRRSTQGSRMTELIGEAAEMDKAFWDSAVWAEEEGEDSGNESFDEREEEARPDEFDSDFNDTETDESDEDEEGQLKAQQRRERSSAAKSGAGYKEPVKAPKPKPRPPASQSSASQSSASQSSASQSSASQSSAPAKPRVRAPVDDTPQELSITLRQSTQSKSTARTQEILSAKAVAKPKVVRPPIPKKEYSQRDLLLEALETEVVNFKWLKSQQMAEEERNRLEAKFTKPTKKIARTLLSNQKASTITFVDDNAWPAIFDATTFSRSRRRNDSSDSDNDGEREPKHASLLCAVTGLPARYRDPLTGLPYYDASSFRQLRETHQAQSSRNELSSDRKGSKVKKKTNDVTATADITNKYNDTSTSSATDIRASNTSTDTIIDAKMSSSGKVSKKKGSRKPKVQQTPICSYVTPAGIY